MPELKGRISGFTTDYKSGKQILTIELDEDFRPYVDELMGKDLTVNMKQWRKKRSLDANAFFWATVGDIAAKLRIPSDEIYREMIRDIGGNYIIVPIPLEEVETWQRNWRGKGLGWICEGLGYSKIDGYENQICYYGSSTYNSEQMSRLCELAAEEAEAQGIKPKLTAAERQAAIELWGERFEKHSAKQ